MSEKNFDGWNEIKKSLVYKSMNDVFINVRDVWYVKLGINVWFEQDGKKDFRRPVLVLKIVWSLYTVVPLTHKRKIKEHNSVFYHTITSCNFSDPSRCILSQLKVIDKKRFMDKIWYVSVEEVIIIKEKIRELCL